MKYDVEIRLTDNREEWCNKELKRLFPNGDLKHVKGALFDAYGRRFGVGYEYFYPREFKRNYKTNEISFARSIAKGNDFICK